MRNAWILLSSLLLIWGQAQAAPKKVTKTVKTASKVASTPSEYSTRMSFEGTSLKGKVQSGSLRKIVVENDKSIDDLLGVRKQFDDREQQEKGRVTSW